MSQSEMLPDYRLTPEQIVESAHAGHSPIVKTFCLFSGGSDSTVLAHRCRDLYDSLCFVDTGTALPGVRDFVEQIAEVLEKNLLIYEAGEAFRELVLGNTTRNPYGFPSARAHSVAYSQLKLHQIQKLVADHKKNRGDRVGLLTGVRSGESKRRAQNIRSLVTRQGAQVWISPIASWSDEEMRAYRDEHGLPLSDVAALIHRSGECNCGSFASPGEREMLQSLWPEWFESTICSLEREATAAGVARDRWGGSSQAVGASPGPMCSDCQLRLMGTDE